MNRRISLNLIGQLLSFFSSIIISFFITPIIVMNIGSEVYGFVGLSNNFTSYISIFTVAISSMLARYVTISYSKKKYQEASEYFSTCIIVLTVVSVILMGPLYLFTINMDHYINISIEQVQNVKLLWSLTFSSFLISLPVGCFGVLPFAKNRLELQSFVLVISNVIKCVLLIILFKYFKANVWYVGLASLIAQLVLFIGYIYIKRKITPEIHLSISNFRKKSIYDLLIIGLWSSFSRIGQMLVTGFDLLLTNIFVSSYQMGLLSIAKTVPALLGTLAGSVLNAFEPTMTIAYACGEKNKFLKSVENAMKMNGFLCAVPMIGFICFGKIFFRLWMPSLTNYEVNQVYILTFLTMFAQIIEIYVQPLYTVYTITKNVKFPVYANVVTGIVNIIIVFILLKVTTWGVYAIAGVSSILYLLRIVLFMPLYASYCLKINWGYFYNILIKGIINIFVLVAIFSLLLANVSIKGWISLAFVSIICGIFGYFISFLIQFDKNEKNNVIDIITKKIKRI